MTINLGGSVQLNWLGQAGSVSNPSGDFWSDRYLTPQPGTALFGYYLATGSFNGGPYPTAAEAQYGRAFDLTIVYDGRSVNGNMGVSGALNVAQTHLAAGRMPRLDLNFTQYVHSGFCQVSQFWPTLAAGTWDEDGVDPGTGLAYKGLKSIFRPIIQLPQRVMVSLWHEFDGQNDGGGDKVGGNGYYSSSSSTRTWYGSGGASNGAQTATEFRAAWQHVVNLVRDLVTNEGGFEPVWYFDAAYEPAANASYGKPGWGTNLTDTGSDGMYPGHNYVDWVGWDPYNFGAVSGHSSRWDNPLDMWKLAGTTWSSQHPSVTWWDYNFKVGGARTAALATSGQGVYKPCMWGETGTNEQWARPPYSLAYTYSSWSAGDGDAGNWMLQLRDLMAPGGGAAGKLMGANWFAHDYYEEASGTFPMTAGQLPMVKADTTLRNDSNACAQRWPALATLGQAAVFKVR